MAKTGKATTASSMKIPAKAAAKKKAGSKTAGSKTAGSKKAGSKKAPAKKVANKAAATKAAGKTTAGKTTAGRAAGKQAAGKQTAGSKTAALQGPLADWVARLDAAADTLAEHPGVKVLVRWQGAPASAGVFDAIEERTGVRLGEAVRNLYTQADGLALVWEPAGNSELEPVRGRPQMPFFERLGGKAGAIFLPPIGEVFGLRGRPFFDYGQFMPDEEPHWGFDFPGNYYTPAFVRSGRDLLVRVGDDHGAAWDGPAVSLERYLEVVLATWGSIDQRAEIFVRGNGAAVGPQPLAALLPAEPGDAVAEAFAEAEKWASTTPELAQGLAAALDAAPEQKQLARWLAAVDRGHETALLAVLFLRSPALREAVEPHLAAQIEGLSEDEESEIGGQHMLALAWSSLHPEDERPAIAARIHELVEQQWELPGWFERAAEWPAMASRLTDLLAMAGDMDAPEQRSSMARLLARRGPPVSAALLEVLAVEPGRWRRLEDMLVDVAPELPLDDAARARVALLLELRVRQVRAFDNDDTRLLAALRRIGAAEQLAALTG